MSKRVSVFVSSPGDVNAERRRINQIAARINSEFSSIAHLDVFRWETGFYGAHATFQRQIREASECDIVIGVLSAKLGSELPGDFPAKMPNGQAYPSGTAYELLTAIEARRTKGKPDVYVFRRKTHPVAPIDDDEKYREAKQQWVRLNAFFEEHFRTPEGHFQAAFHSYESVDEFADQVERLLRSCLQKELAIKAEAQISWRIDIKGSPFRSLDAFEARHTAVFFGRSRDTEAALERISAAAGRGVPFLLVVGASGVGKSSFVGAGLLPRLTTAGVIEEVDVWRVATMRAGTDPVRKLAEALFAGPASGGAGEGALAAMPELADGDYQTAADLASLMQAAPGESIKPLLGALARIGAQEQQRESYSRAVRADLALFVDQLDELFGGDVPDKARSAFLNILAALVSTKRIWLIATLRADLYDRILSDPVLSKLKQQGADYDLTRPGPREIADIIRSPAKAAGLSYESKLDERLIRDAGEGDTLPLLQFTLQRLYEEREVVDGRVQLTLKAYTDKIGGIDGAIDQAAEGAFATLSDHEQGRLPELLRKLAGLVRESSSIASTRSPLTIRSVPRALLDRDPAVRRLVAALVQARILTADRHGNASTVRLAHQRVLESWKRACELVAANADFYRISSELEDQRRRWEASGRRAELLVPAGLPLEEAKSILDRFREEIPVEAKEFIIGSNRRARFRQHAAAAAAVVFAGVAVIAAVNWYQSTKNLGAAVAAISALVEAASETVQPIAELDKVEQLIDQARDAINRFAAITEDPRISGQRARALLIMAEIDWDRGNLSRMQTQADEAFRLFDALANRGDADAVHFRARARRLIGLAHYEANRGNEARAQYDQAIAELSELLGSKGQNESSWRWQRSLADLHQDLGDVLLFRLGQAQQARAAFEKCYQARLRLVELGHRGTPFALDLSWAANKHGDVFWRTGDPQSALEWFTKAQKGFEDVGESIWDNLLWAIRMALIHNNIGLVHAKAERYSEAVDSFSRGQTILARVIKRDPKNRARYSAVGWTYDNRGEALFRWALATHDTGRLREAHAEFKSALSVRERLADQSVDRVQWQLGLISTRASIGAVEGMLLDWDQKPAAAAPTFIAAADLLVDKYLPGVAVNSRPDIVLRAIEYLDWGASAYARAGLKQEAVAQFERQLVVVNAHAGALDPQTLVALEQRIRRRLAEIRP